MLKDADDMGKDCPEKRAALTTFRNQMSLVPAKGLVSVRASTQKTGFDHKRRVLCWVGVGHVSKTS